MHKFVVNDPYSHKISKENTRKLFACMHIDREEDLKREVHGRLGIG